MKLLGNFERRVSITAPSLILLDGGLGCVVEIAVGRSGEASNANEFVLRQPHQFRGAGSFRLPKCGFALGGQLGVLLTRKVRASTPMDAS